MFTIKLLGACLLALAGWYGGAAVCGRVSTHRAALGEAIALLKTLEEEIAFRRANLNTVYAQLSLRNAFPLLGLSIASQAKKGQVDGQFQTLQPPPSFTKEERTAFCSCFARLGYTGAQQECERLARYRKQFEGFYSAAQKKEQAALAIDRKIGLAVGGMVAIILL